MNNSTMIFKKRKTKRTLENKLRIIISPLTKNICIKTYKMHKTVYNSMINRGYKIYGIKNNSIKKTMIENVILSKTLICLMMDLKIYII